MVKCTSVLAALLLLGWTSNIGFAQELTTDAERDWKAVRSSDDVRTKIMAERWFNAIRQQEWSDASGKFRVSAKYVDHDPNLKWVKLRTIRGTGKERQVKDVKIPLEKLSKSCQARVRTISVLAEKIAEAKEEEAKKETEEEAGAGATGGRDGETAEGELMEGETPAEPREGRAPFDRGPAEMDSRAQMAERDSRDDREGAGAEPLSVTSVGPPLPAMLPPLPSGNLAAQPSSPEVGDASVFQHPTSADELKAVFIKAFDAGDKDTIEKLIFWGESTPEQRELTQSYIIDKAGIAKIVRVDLETLPENEPVEDYTISTTTRFEIEYENETLNHTLDWPFAAIDGKYYFGAWLPKAASERR